MLGVDRLAFDRLIYSFQLLCFTSELFFLSRLSLQRFRKPPLGRRLLSALIMFSRLHSQFVLQFFCEGPSLLQG